MGPVTIDESTLRAKSAEQIRDFLANQRDALAVWERWSVTTRREAEWRCLVQGGWTGPSFPPSDPPRTLGVDRTEIVKIKSAVSVKVRAAAPQPAQPENVAVDVLIRSVVWVGLFEGRGELAAGFSSDDVPYAARRALENLAQRIRNDLMEARRARESRTLLQLPTAPARVEDAKQGLQVLADEVARIVDGGGAKIYLVRRSPLGPQIQRFAKGPPQVNPQPVPYSATRGLADYVIREKTWLLIPHCAPTGTPNEDGIPQEAVNGRDKQITVNARSGKDIDKEAEGTDDEATILTFPLETDGQVTGAVSVLRVRPDDGGDDPPPFDVTLDVDSLRNFAPHLAAACQRLLHLEKAEEQLKSTMALASSLAAAKTLQDGYEAVAQGAGQLADAGLAVLLHFEPQKTNGTLYQSAFWAHRDLKWMPLEGPLRIDTSRKSKTWEDEVRSYFSTTPLVLRRLLIAAPTETPHLALALFDPRPEEGTPSYFSDQLLEHFADSFFQGAAVSLRSLARDLGSRLLDELGGPPVEGGNPLGPNELLDQAAQLLSTAVGADQVAIYTGPFSFLRVRGSFPRLQLEDGNPATSSTLLERCLRTPEEYRVPELTTSERSLDRSAARTLAKRSGWKSIRSWAAYPLLHEGRTFGALELATRGSGRFLGRDHEDIARQVARHVAWELHRAVRQRALEGLLARLNEQVVGKRGRELGERLIVTLNKWAASELLRPDARALIIARSRERGTLVRAGADEKVLHEFDQNLEALVERFKARNSFWNSQEAAPLTTFTPCGVAEALGEFGDPSLSGIVCLGASEPFGTEEAEALREAGRLLAVILSVERERNELKEVMGRFRHAALGPIQGLASAAHDLADFALSSGAPPDKINPARIRVSKEAEFLRLWRDHQRFYLTDEIELRRRRQGIRALVNRCFARYREIVADRNSYDIIWRLQGDPILNIDEPALDLALSNLLDNAAKYAFFNREIHLGVESVPGSVEIWVEDVGHGVDEKELERNLQLKERSAPIDPFRFISGQGLGLALVARIVQGHDGSLTVRSTRLGRGEREETTPYRVRFTMHLPYFKH